VKCLSSKFKAAAKAIPSSKATFEDMNDAIRPELKKLWLTEEKMALESRGEHLKIYDVQLEKSMVSTLFVILT